MNSSYASVAEMARVMMREEETIRRQIRAGRIEATKIGREYQIGRAELEKHRAAIQHSLNVAKAIADNPAQKAAIKKAAEFAASINVTSPQVEAVRKAAKENALWAARNSDLHQKSLEGAKRVARQVASLQLDQAEGLIQTLQREARAHYGNINYAAIERQAKETAEMVRSAASLPMPYPVMPPIEPTIYASHRPQTESRNVINVPLPSDKEGRAKAAKALRELADALEASEDEAPEDVA